jgi:hypothetical protein
VVGDVVVTGDELGGLMAELVTTERPGILQQAEVERRDMHLPQLSVISGPEGVSGVEVRMGNEPVDVFATIQSCSQP